ncbi:hypothetical protein DMJ13_27220 [halophilic archaeon]|nr:hypothetical protein DMJ13_27220 [halophilic archaeon]
MTTDEIEERFAPLVNDYKLPLEEACRSIVSTYPDDSDSDRDDLRNNTQEITLDDVTDSEQWIGATVKVVDLWEPRSDVIAQVGLLGDETGTLKFTNWAKFDLPEFAHGRMYRLGNVVNRFSMDEREGDDVKEPTNDGSPNEVRCSHQSYS